MDSSGSTTSGCRAASSAAASRLMPMNRPAAVSSNGAVRVPLSQLKTSAATANAEDDADARAGAAESRRGAVTHSNKNKRPLLISSRPSPAALATLRVIRPSSSFSCWNRPPTPPGARRQPTLQAAAATEREARGGRRCGPDLKRDNTALIKRWILIFRALFLCEVCAATVHDPTHAVCTLRVHGPRTEPCTICAPYCAQLRMKGKHTSVHK